MDGRNHKCHDSEISDVSTEQDSQESLIIIPDSSDSHNSSYSNIADYDSPDSQRVVDFCKILPNAKNCKSTETSFIDYDTAADASRYSTPISKSLSETLFFCNKVMEPYHQPLLAENVDYQTSEKNVRITENYSDFSFPVKEVTSDYFPKKSLTLRLCANSIQNLRESSGSNYQSTCISDRKEATGGCVDKTVSEICEGKSTSNLPKSCTIRDRNSARNTKGSCSNMKKSLSKSSMRSSESQELKNVEEKFSCLPAGTDTCCSARLRMPKCKPVPPPKKPEMSCCSILENFKSSYTNVHICSPHYPTKPQSSSSQQNDSTPSISKEDTISTEKIMTCISTTEDNKKECKNKPSYCANAVIIKGSNALLDGRHSLLRLNKCPSKINIENMRYDHQSLDDSLKSEDDHSGVLTESTRNYDTYYEFNNTSKPRNISNCMKVKVIPSTTDLTQSAISVTKMKIDLNETIPTCKITSDDFTEVAKDFFGSIYTRTRDAVTTITRESIAQLGAFVYRTRSCNTDGTVLRKDKCVETPALTREHSSTVNLDRNPVLEKRRGKKLASGASDSTVNFCTCRRYRVECSHVAIQEPPAPPNSVFTAIKSKIFSIFREDEASFHHTPHTDEDSDSDESALTDRASRRTY